MTHEAYAATLHTQFAYRLQTHSIDLAYPRENEDSLYITIDPNQDPTCYFVPKQIPRDELLKLLPDKWVTHYEKSQSSKQPLQIAEPSFKVNEDGSTEITFP